MRAACGLTADDPPDSRRPISEFSERQIGALRFAAESSVSALGEALFTLVSIFSDALQEQAMHYACERVVAPTGIEPANRGSGRSRRMYLAKWTEIDPKP
jgi:hypothetical protein